MEVDVTDAGAAWCLAEQVAKGPPHVNPWARKGFIDEPDLMMKCVVEPEHKPGLVYQL